MMALELDGAVSSNFFQRVCLTDQSAGRFHENRLPEQETRERTSQSRQNCRHFRDNVLVLRAQKQHFSMPHNDVHSPRQACKPVSQNKLPYSTNFPAMHEWLIPTNQFQATFTGAIYQPTKGRPTSLQSFSKRKPVVLMGFLPESCEKRLIEHLTLPSGPRSQLCVVPLLPCLWVTSASIVRLWRRQPLSAASAEGRRVARFLFICCLLSMSQMGPDVESLPVDPSRFKSSSG